MADGLVSTNFRRLLKKLAKPELDRVLLFPGIHPSSVHATENETSGEEGKEAPNVFDHCSCRFDYDQLQALSTRLRHHAGARLLWPFASS